MRILVTGATGFLGRNLLNKMESNNVAIVVREYVYELNHFHQIIFDQNDIVLFRKLIHDFNPDIVIHLASYLSSLDDQVTIKQIIDSNILFSTYLLEAIKDTNMSLFINTGTFAEFYYNDGQQNPAYFYAASKSAFRSFIKYFKNISNFKTINIIPYTIYGGISKSKKVIDLIIDSFETIEPIDMSSGEQLLDFIHIDDVVDFYIYCISNNNLMIDETDYHLGTGVGTTIRELAILLEKIFQKKANIKWGIRSYRPLDIMRAIAPIYKLEKELGWKPRISLHQGLKGMYNDQTRTTKK